MWCSDCQQDVPAIASKSDSNAVVCARCRKQLSDPSAGKTAAQARSPDARKGHDDPLTAMGPTIDLDDWQLDEDLQAAEHLSNRYQASPAATDEPAPRSDVGAAAEALLAAAHVQAHSGHRTPDLFRSHQNAAPRQPQRTWVAWTFLSIGLMTFVCGAVLSGLSFMAGQAELWNIGLPMVLSGQAALLLGLVFQLEGLWQNNRETCETLGELDDQIADLRQATTLLHSTHGAAAQSFYAHMAQGASPHLLLADLKGQLDMLAVKMAQER